MADQIAIQEALQSALDFESKGHDYYLEVAQSAQNPLTREVFEALADQELVHAERIKEIYSRLNVEDMQPHTHSAGMEQMVRSIFSRFSSRERQAWEMDNAEAYEHAQDLEQKSIDLYQRLAGESDDPAKKRFFDELVQEESEHLRALENVSNYLRHTGDWFASDESRVWNWMNT